jgi:hypothetical protein
LVLQVYSILNLAIFIFLSGPAGVKEFKKGDSQTKDQKTPKTRRKHAGFRNGLGTVRGVYEANTIAHRTPPALAVTMVGGTCGVLKTSFWPNIASALPTVDGWTCPKTRPGGARGRAGRPRPGATSDTCWVILYLGNANLFKITILNSGRP